MFVTDGGGMWCPFRLLACFTLNPKGLGVVGTRWDQQATGYELGWRESLTQSSSPDNLYNIYIYIHVYLDILSYVYLYKYIDFYSIEGFQGQPWSNPFTSSMWFETIHPRIRRVLGTCECLLELQPSDLSNQNKSHVGSNTHKRIYDLKWVKVQRPHPKYLDNPRTPDIWRWIF